MSGLHSHLGVGDPFSANTLWSPLCPPTVAEPLTSQCGLMCAPSLSLLTLLLLFPQYSLIQASELVLTRLRRQVEQRKHQQGLGDKVAPRLMEPLAS